MKSPPHHEDRYSTRARRSPALITVLIAVACLALAAGVAASVAAAADSPLPAATAPSAAASSATVTYRVGVLETVDSLNPFVGLMSPSYQVYGLNYDTLVGWEPVNLDPRPEFAESWTVSPDGKTWDFKIRSGMTWQDGQPATARDVAFTFNYIIDNQLSAYSTYTTYIKHVTAVDDTTARFECSKPKGDMLQMSVPILPEHIWSKIPPKEAGSTFKNGPPSIGSGPFQVTEDKKGDYVRLVANKDYWAGAPQIDELFFQTYTNADSMMADLDSGAIDAVVSVPVAQFKALDSSSGITPNACTFWSFAQVSINSYDSPDSKGNPVLLDQRFRQALQYAVDRQTIANIAFSGYADVGETLMPPYSKYFWQPPPEEAYGFDPEKAKSLLEAAGYKDVNGDGMRETADGKPLSLRLYAPTSDASYSSAAKLVAGQLKAIGLQIKLDMLDDATLTDRIWSYSGNTYTPDYDLFIWYWLGGSDPTFITNLLTTSQIGAWSDTGWSDAEYDKLFEQQTQAVDPQGRIDIVAQMQQMVHTASPYLILNFPQQLEAYNTAKWEGYVPAPSGTEGYNGAVIQNPDQIDTYLSLHPKGGETATGSGGSNTWVVIVIVAVIVVALIAWLVMRGRGKAVEEG